MCTKSELDAVLTSVKDESVSLYGDKLDKIILFGSYARGDYTDESDVDIMVVLDCDKAEVKAFWDQTVEMESDISLEQEVLVSIVLRDKKHFEENLDFLPFYQNVAREGVVVYG